ncbi:MAG: GNAT family N-acetyltransferase [Leptolyngbyaceae cyanobacterium MO_188.B28]|nr:GNAT family N-acetyltransferase [Leptolyngbyaceae cyanobacterium MO_188.B28]
MLNITTVQVRKATQEEDSLIAAHFYHMWLDADVPESAINPDWRSTVIEYIETARQTLNYQAFIAQKEDVLVGSVGCQQFAGLYPDVLKPDYRRYGYIWGVYVEPAHRKQGIATQLTQSAIAHLKAIGCTHALLNASPLGESVYKRLGFAPTNAMRLTLRPMTNH